jgi:hypothetical protein
MMPPWFCECCDRNERTHPLLVFTWLDEFAVCLDCLAAHDAMLAEALREETPDAPH